MSQVSTHHVPFGDGKVTHNQVNDFKNLDPGDVNCTLTDATHIITIPIQRKGQRPANGADARSGLRFINGKAYTKAPGVVRYASGVAGWFVIPVESASTRSDSVQDTALRTETVGQVVKEESKVASPLEQAVTGEPYPVSPIPNSIKKKKSN